MFTMTVVICSYSFIVMYIDSLIHCVVGDQSGWLRAFKQRLMCDDVALGNEIRDNVLTTFEQDIVPVADFMEYFDVIGMCF